MKKTLALMLILASFTFSQTHMFVVNYKTSIICSDGNCTVSDIDGGYHVAINYKNEPGVLYFIDAQNQMVLYPIGQKDSSVNSSGTSINSNEYMDQNGAKLSMLYWSSGLSLIWDEETQAVFTICSRENICDCYIGKGTGCRSRNRLRN